MNEIITVMLSFPSEASNAYFKNNQNAKWEKTFNEKTKEFNTTGQKPVLKIFFTKMHARILRN